jgi:putative hydrolase of the HAD superfamily
MKIEVVFFDIGDTLVADKKWLPGVKPLLAKLRANQVRVGLISNTGKFTRDQLAELLPEDFDFADFEEGLVMLSSEVGIQKPSLAIFSLAVQHAGVSPWATMFVCEDLRHSLAAQSAGMMGARIDGSENDFKNLAKSILQ